MSTFNEELTAARKAKGMTQEQLAEAMNASRSAVSHWESGRSIPDVETLKKLCTVLECTFSMLTTRQNDVPETEEKVPLGSEQSAQKVPVSDASVKRPKTKQIIVLAAAAALLVLIACIVIPKLNGKPQDSEPSTIKAPTLTAVVPPKANSVEWYSSPVQPESGRPFVAVQFNESPLRARIEPNLGDFPVWIYTIYLTETNGFALDIKHIDTVIFKANGDPDIISYNAGTLNDWFDGSHDVPANGQRIFNGGMPLTDNLVGVGVCVTGTDENGEELDFHAYLPLSQEIHE